MKSYVICFFAFLFTILIALQSFCDDEKKLSTTDEKRHIPRIKCYAGDKAYDYALKFSNEHPSNLIICNAYDKETREKIFANFLVSLDTIIIDDMEKIVRHFFDVDVVRRYCPTDKWLFLSEEKGLHMIYCMADGYVGEVELLVVKTFGDTYSIDFYLDKAEEIELTIVDEDNSPVKDAIIKIVKSGLNITDEMKEKFWRFSKEFSKNIKNFNGLITAPWKDTKDDFSVFHSAYCGTVKYSNDDGKAKFYLHPYSRYWFYITKKDCESELLYLPLYKMGKLIKQKIVLRKLKNKRKLIVKVLDHETKKPLKNAVCSLSVSKELLEKKLKNGDGIGFQKYNYLMNISDSLEKNLNERVYCLRREGRVLLSDDPLISTEGQGIDKFMFTNEEGVAIFEYIEPVEWFLEVRALGYEQKDLGPVNLEEKVDDFIYYNNKGEHCRSAFIDATNLFGEKTIILSILKYKER